MSLRYALLGMLADRTASGYELTRKFERTLDRYAWHAQHNQIYQELNRLAGDGLIEVVERGARGRKTYALAEKGREELRTWLHRPPRKAVVRNEFMLRLFLLFALDPAEARGLLAHYAEDIEGELTELRALVDAPETGSFENPLAFGNLAADFGLHLLPALRDWAHSAIERIDGELEAEGAAEAEAEAKPGTAPGETASRKTASEQGADSIAGTDTRQAG